MTHPLRSLLPLAAAGLLASADGAALTIHADRAGVAISPTLYGIFFEEINRAGDGGLYGEMLENRSFEDGPGMTAKAREPQAWTAVGSARIALDTSLPLHPRNPTALRLELAGAGGVAQAGFKGAGLAIRKGEAYRLCLHARSDGQVQGLTARLASKDGAILAERPIAGIGKDWTRAEVELTAGAEDLQARLVLGASASGTVWLDMVSLFPTDTWKGHGLRKDLAEMVAAMKPAFVRFPGGCFVEGDTMPMATRWKETIGDAVERKGNWCIWGYQTTGGFGAYEFFQWCEDLGAEPLYVINCGMSHKEHVPMEKMPEYVQDALDLIEYARGPADSTWGARRAKAGHPAPFRLHFMEIGNENGGPLYHERYALFHDAIKAKYPDMKLVANEWHGTPSGRPLDIVDEHYYNSPDFFTARTGMYDTYDRAKPKIYVGEYAVTRDCGQGNLIAALGEAAYMTGLERNADHVIMASYAPLFVNPPWRHWNPNAIVFDQARAYGTPSYHVQALFGANRGDVVCPCDLEAPPMFAAAPAGGIGVGTWATQAEFKDITVVKDGRTVFQSDFTKGLKPWRLGKGKGETGNPWKVVDGVLCQGGEGEGTHAVVGDASWGTDYTLSLKARKTGGKEGFLVQFQLRSDKERHWWNLGGWGNSAHGLEIGGDDVKVPGSIETGRWYDIRIETRGTKVACFLDGKLIQEAEQRRPMKALHAVASRTLDGRTLILKVVNVGSQDLDTAIAVQGVAGLASTASAQVLTSADNNDENSFEAPRKVAPLSVTVAGIAPRFNHVFPARSVTVLRLGMEK